MGVIVKHKEERPHDRGVLNSVLSDGSLFGGRYEIRQGQQIKSNFNICVVFQAYKERTTGKPNLCVVFQGCEDLSEPTKLNHGVLVRVELVERLRLVSLKKKTL